MGITGHNITRSVLMLCSAAHIITVKSEIKDAPNYKPPPITSRTKLPNIYNISRPRIQAALKIAK